MRCQVLVILAVFDHQSMGHNLDMRVESFFVKLGPGLIVFRGQDTVWDWRLW